MADVLKFDITVSIANFVNYFELAYELHADLAQLFLCKRSMQQFIFETISDIKLVI